MVSLEKTQENVLPGLIRQARDTLIGRKFGFNGITGYASFRKQVPVQSYADLLPYIEQMKQGERNILWPGVISDFAVSSGTTGKGKHLPLSKERLRSDRRFMRKLILRFLRQCPNPQIWMGKQASLPGSVEDVSYYGRHLAMGEISGFTARDAPGWLLPFQAVSPRQLSRVSWKAKFDICVQEAIRQDIRVLTAVPSWILPLFQKALEVSGNTSIDRLWPHLQLIVGGGVALKNYRNSIKEYCLPLKLHFMESYGASEGYFAFTRRLNRLEMELITDNGIFYEWVPFEPGLTESQLGERALPTWRVEKGRSYIMLVTTNGGLWRYPVNDVVRFTRTDPPCIEVQGRVSEMLDDYGEAVHYSELETALRKAQKQAGGRYRRLFVSVHPPVSSDLPHHIWLILWDKPPDCSETSLAQMMDKSLIACNRHYAIRRESGAMGHPECVFLRDGQEVRLNDNPEGCKAQSKPVHILPFEKLPEDFKETGRIPDLY